MWSARADFEPHVYLQGVSEALPGLSDTLVSVLAVRSDEISRSLSDRVRRADARDQGPARHKRPVAQMPPRVSSRALSRRFATDRCIGFPRRQQDFRLKYKLKERRRFSPLAAGAGLLGAKMARLPSPVCDRGRGSKTPREGDTVLNQSLPDLHDSLDALLVIPGPRSGDRDPDAQVEKNEVVRRRSS